MQNLQTLERQLEQVNAALREIDAEIEAARIREEAEELAQELKRMNLFEGLEDE